MQFHNFLDSSSHILAEYNVFFYTMDVQHIFFFFTQNIVYSVHILKHTNL